MKKVLFVANSDRHIKLCHIPYLKMFKDNGYLVHVATNSSNNITYCDKKIDLGLSRHPFSFKNIKALLKLRKIVKMEKYDIISSHTPMGGFLGRSCVIGRKIKPKIFYTAHGFHFFKGCKKRNWILYYPIEKFLSRYTTCLMTMNDEDYILAKEKFYCPIYKINGIGYDDKRLIVNKKRDLKKELGLNGYYIVTYIAEISKRKNQINLINELNKYDLEKEKIKVLLIGDSIIPNFLNKIKNDNIIYIDFKENIGDYINISDLFISASLQEGLPLSVLEAMSFNKMFIGLDIRGNRDLINGKNGLLVSNVQELVKKMIKYKNSNHYQIKNDTRKYQLNNVIKDIRNIYNNYLEDELK